MAKEKDEVNSSADVPEQWRIAGRAISVISTKPGSYKPKIGGAKNTGKHTGIYTLATQNGEETMLIKQGDTVAETVAEFIGGNLYQLTIPRYAAKAYLARAEGVSDFKKEDVYVTSVFEREGRVQDAFKVAGYSERPTFARARENFKKNLGIKDETLIRKVILDDKESGNSSLGFSVANALWHGDHDVHMGNFVKITDLNNPNNNRYMKIDHGFSFFNFGQKIVNIFNPFAGRKISINPARLLRNEGKIIEFYPFNNFWDLAAEKKDFYFSGSFIKGCEDIINLQAYPINENIKTSLKMVQEMYGDQADDVLKAFCRRIGMNQRKTKNKSGEKLVDAIAHHMTMRLVKRQKSLVQVADYCRAKISSFSHEHHIISRQLDSEIIKLLDHLDRMGKYKQSEEKNTLESKVEFYKLLSQANDLGCLKVNAEGELYLESEVYLLNSGKRCLIKPQDFKAMLDKYKANLSNEADIKIIAQAVQSFNRETSSEERVARKSVLSSFKKEDPKQTWVRVSADKSGQDIQRRDPKVPAKKGHSS